MSPSTTPGLVKDEPILLGRSDVTSPVVPRWHVQAWALPAGTAARHARRLIEQLLTDGGFAGGPLDDAVTVVAELAANAEVHAAHPYELRVVMIGSRPIWCEVVDADGRVADVAEHLNPGTTAAMAESGRGLAMVATLSGGRCAVYPATAITTDAVGKAVAFAFPGRR